jgi:hypothetical protein
MPKSPKLGKMTFSSLSLPEQIQMSNLQDAVNILGGHSGEVELSGHLNLSGNKITNVGPAESESDVLTSGQAETKYSAEALRPHLQANGKVPLATYRMLNSKDQRENSSSWLNNLLSTPPNSNSINPIVSSGGGSTTVTIPASILQMGDGSKRYLPSRTDVLTNPANYSISTFTVALGVATVNLSSTPSPALAANTVIYISGTGQIDGTYPIASILSPTSFTINVTSGVSGAGGTVETGGVSYYYLDKSFNKVNLSTLPSASDTPFHRLGISGDGFQLLAVVSINSSGHVQVGTAGGATPSIVSTANAGSRF